MPQKGEIDCLQQETEASEDTSAHDGKSVGLADVDGSHADTSAVAAAGTGGLRTPASSTTKGV